MTTLGKRNRLTSYLDVPNVIIDLYLSQGILTNIYWPGVAGYIMSL